MSNSQINAPAVHWASRSVWIHRGVSTARIHSQKNRAALKEKLNGKMIQIVLYRIMSHFGGNIFPQKSHLHEHNERVACWFFKYPRKKDVQKKWIGQYCAQVQSLQVSMDHCWTDINELELMVSTWLKSCPQKCVSFTIQWFVPLEFERMKNGQKMTEQIVLCYVCFFLSGVVLLLQQSYRSQIPCFYENTPTIAHLVAFWYEKAARFDLSTEAYLISAQHTLTTTLSLSTHASSPFLRPPYDPYLPYFPMATRVDLWLRFAMFLSIENYQAALFSPFTQRNSMIGWNNYRWWEI